MPNRTPSRGPCPTGVPGPNAGAELGTLLFHLVPPYRGAMVHLDLPNPAEDELPDGSVLLLQPPAGAPSAVLQGLIGRVRARFPEAAVLIRAADSPVPASLAAALVQQLDGVIGPGEPLGEALRRQLTDVEGLGTRVVAWLGRRGVSPSPFSALLIAQLVQRAPGHAQAHDLCRSIGVDLGTAAGALRADALPHPALWLRMARTLHAVIRLQAAPEAGLHAVARQAGFSAASVLDSECARLFALRPDALRATLGWRWLLWRWLPGALARTRTRDAERAA